MNSTLMISQKKPKPRVYPWLGVIERTKGKKIVLFTSPNNGVVIYNNDADSGQPVGHTSNSIWIENDFKPYEGQVILEND